LTEQTTSVPEGRGAIPGLPLFRRARYDRAVPLPALEVRAPAKVNLVLRVGPARADGYHDIESLMVPISLADLVRVRVRRGPQVTCRVPARPELDGAANLAARAAEAFRRRFAVRAGCDVVVEKRIPVVAGLGGGSSDAAAVLRALARAHAVRDREALAAAALEIGSDVPFFLGPGPAWATGRGEALEPAEVPVQHLVLAYPRDPALAIRAGDAYRWLDVAREGSPDTGGPPRRRRAFAAGAARNDLEAECLARFPALAETRRRLEECGARAAMMSGSGPTVFGIFASRAQARRATFTLRRELAGTWELHLVRTLRRHPGVTPWKSPRSASSR
jgi:4-diphosphocytidyl-2-C-methyl-D-erythritol kinase